MPRNDHPSNWPANRASLALDYHDRLLLAYAQCQLTQVRRDGFFSNDDVLDAAEAWTTTDMAAWADDATDSSDYVNLVEELNAAIWPDEYTEPGR